MRVRAGGQRAWAMVGVALALGCGANSPDGDPSASGGDAAAAFDALQGGGRTAWVRQLGGVGTEGVLGIAPAPDGGQVLLTSVGDGGPMGQSPTTIGLVRLRRDRTVAWSHEYLVGPEQVSRLSVAVTPTLGNVFLSLHIDCAVGENCLDFGGGQAADSILVKFDPSGRFVWQKAIGQTIANLTGVAVDPTGDTAVAVTGAAGPWISKFRWDGASLLSIPAIPVHGGAADPFPSALALDQEGSLIVGDGLAVYKVLPDGTLAWSALLGSPAVPGRITSVGVTSKNTVVALAQVESGTVGVAGDNATLSNGVYLAVFEANGAPRLGRVIANDGRTATGAAVDVAGRVAVLTRGSGACDERIEEWNLAGEQLWSRTVAGCRAGATLASWGVAVDAGTHHVRVGGTFTGSVNFGTGPVTSRGESDDFLIDLAP